MVAYDGLAVQNFYLGHIKECKYYQERAIRGIYESDQSSNKKSAIQFFKRGVKDKDPMESIQIEKEFNIKINHKVGQEIEVIREGANSTIDFTCKMLVEI
jgi:hypothetical protein